MSSTFGEGSCVKNHSSPVKSVSCMASGLLTSWPVESTVVSTATRAFFVSSASFVMSSSFVMVQR